MNELYRFVSEVTNDCLWEWNLLTKELLWIDGGHKRVFGYAIENSIVSQAFWEDCVHPEDRAGVLSRLNHVISEGVATLWEDEYRFKKVGGGYAFVHDRGHIIYEEGKPLRMVGATQDITERVVLQNKLSQEREARQREITRAVLMAQEKERAEIGQELHDNLGQVLAIAKMYIQMAKKGNSDTYLTTSCDYIEQVIIGIRKIAKNLIIPATHIISLVDNIKNLLNDVKLINAIIIEFDPDNIDEKDLDENMQVNIFRIVQEQLNNILKHANATRASINLSRRGNEVMLLISDNGKGCEPSEKKSGVGIINIKSRVELYHGSVAIVSNPGQGFELTVILPLIAA